MWHGYLLISELPPGWTQEQREAAFAALRALGRQQAPQPAQITHTRLRPDGKALIVEGELAEAEITRASVVAAIAAALDVQRSAVDARIEYTVFAAGQDYRASGDACRAYLAANQAAWGEL